MKITVGPSGSIYWEDRSFTPPRGGSYSPARPLRDDAPQAVKDLAAQHWTPEVIATAKAKAEAAARPRVGA